MSDFAPNPKGSATSAASIPVVVASDQSTIPVSLSSQPLPSGASTETTLSAINTKIPASPATDRATAAAPSSVRLSDGSAFYKGTTPSDTQPISAASLPLPSGAATSAAQTTGNASLSSMDTKTPALGQALSAASSPVVLPATQITTLTPPAAITNYANETGGNLATIAGSITSSVSQQNLKQVNGVTTQTGTGTAGTGSQRVAVASDSSLTANIGTTNGLALDATLTGGSQKIQGNVASAATDSGNPLKTGAVYNTTPPTFTNGQRSDTQADVNGNTKNTLATLIAGEDLTNNKMIVEQRNSFSTSTTATTTTHKSGAGFLHTITIAGGTAGAITVYDNTAGSGTTIIPAFTPGSVSTPVTLTLDVSFATGLTIVTAAATVISVSYR